MRLSKFAGRWGLYNFPPQTSGNDNFSSVLANTTRLPGVDGGYDVLNTRRSPQSVGKVSGEWWIQDKTRSMTALRDEVGQIAWWGKSRLFSDVWEDPRQDKRWCWARLNDTQMSENVKMTPHAQQKIAMNFQVNEPGWKGGQKLIYFNQSHYFDDGWYFDGPLYFDEGHLFDAGFYFNPPKGDQQMVSGDTMTVTNRGTRPAKAILTIAASTNEEGFLGDGTVLGDGSYLDSAVGPVGGVRVVFSANGQTDSEFVWGDTMQPGEMLIIDAAAQTVMVNGRTDRTGYPAFQRIKGYGFITVPPGESTLTITGGIPDQGCHVTLDFWDEFYTS